MWQVASDMKAMLVPHAIFLSPVTCHLSPL